MSDNIVLKVSKSSTPVKKSNNDQVNLILSEKKVLSEKKSTKKTKSNSNNNSSDSGEYKISADAYCKKTPIEHVYTISDSYIGSDEKVPRTLWIYNFETKKFNEQDIELPEGIENLFLEISSNAIDNVSRSRKNNVDPGKLTIKMDSTTITLRNEGIPIPVEMHPEEKVWAPELIFGDLLTSSNYESNEDRTECGRNGYGAKLTNIYSKFFQVTIGDHHNQKLYTQVWKDNMKIKEEPVIKSYNKSKGFVEVVYKLDFPRFKYESYPQEAFSLFARHAADISLTGRIPVHFNDEVFEIKKIKDYVKLYISDPDKIKSSVVWNKWKRGTETETIKGVEYSTDKSLSPLIEICAVDTPDNPINVSFANGKWTRNCGVHADSAFKALTVNILETINTTGGKKSKKQRTLKIKESDVKKHVSVFVVCRQLKNTKWDNQYKTALRTPTPKIDIDEAILKPILRWELLARLYAELDAKHFKETSKSDGKKRRHVNVSKLEDANFAGDGEKGLKCTLWVTEGDSAMSFAVKALSFIPDGRDYIGLFPLKGKPLNVMNAPVPQIANNSEINSLKKVLGLREGVNYLEEENFKTLRYGHFMILADSDVDGKHILGLVLNLFHCKYPSLLARGYVMYLRTKIVEVNKGRRRKKFYTEHEYELWKEKTPDYKSWEHHYFKGLGTSEDSDIEKEFQAPKIVSSIYDNVAPYHFQLAFDNRMANQRKKWIADWEPDYRVEQMTQQPITSFLNHEFIQFSISDLARSVPRFLDGLKISQRKILWTAIQEWKGSIGKKKSKQMKVAIFASQVSGKCQYKHGEKSLEGAIVGMAQDYIGSNNLPYLYRHGQFGCVHPDTKILMFDGSIKLAKNIKLGDKLIGDDGKVRNVLNLVNGTDDMYEISQSHGKSYIVNSIHILTLIYSKHKKIKWNKKHKFWYVKYVVNNEKIEEKVVYCQTTTKQLGYVKISEFVNNIPNDNTIDIPLNKYLKIISKVRKNLHGFKYIPNHVSLNYSEIKVKKLGFGKYVGWQIDGNERFLLADYTVTHNTRNMLGKDASSGRYIYTKPEWWIPYLFKKEDMSLLEIQEDEGEKVEPVTLLPILPMQLINGCLGIGTGHSTFVPNHNPLDICKWLEAKIKNISLPQLIPWYRGFEGELSIKEKVKQVDTSESETEDDNDSDDEDKVCVDKYTKRQLISKGIYEVSGTKRKKIIVTELPIGKATNKYTQFLEQLRENKVITRFNNHSTHDRPKFEIYGMKKPSLRKLRLMKTFGLSNMVLLDNNNKPLKFADAEEMMEVFYHTRLPYYQLRKDNMLNTIQSTVNLLNEKIRFIKAVIKGHELLKSSDNITDDYANENEAILVIGRTKENIKSQMVKMEFDEELLKKVTLYHCTVEELQKAYEEISELEKEKLEKEKIKPEEYWLSDIQEFVTAYCKEYKVKYNPPKNLVLQISE